MKYDVEGGAGQRCDLFEVSGRSKVNNMTSKNPQERTFSDRNTEWSKVGLPKELQHDSIAFHRDVGICGYDAYQIGFDQTWLPYDYKPESYEMTYARIERHSPPYWPWWMRLFTIKQTYLVVVLTEKSAFD